MGQTVSSPLPGSSKFKTKTWKFMCCICFVSTAVSPCELSNQNVISCTLQLINKTDEKRVFQIKNTNPEYCFEPMNGVVLPGSTCDITITMKAGEKKKEITCSFLLTNKTKNCGAFKVETTNPKMYSVKPCSGETLPNTTYQITVTIKVQEETPFDDMKCKDKFLLQSIVVKPVATKYDIAPATKTPSDKPALESKTI